MTQTLLQGTDVSDDSSEFRNSEPGILGSKGFDEPAKPDGTLHGLRQWILIGGMYLGVYLVGLDLIMISTVCRTRSLRFCWQEKEGEKKSSNAR